MANIAEGFVTIKSSSEALLDDLRTKVETGPFKIFHYGGPVDIDVFGKKEGELTIGFTGRWNCSAAWSFFDTLMADVNYTYADDLVRAEIRGTEREDGAGYSVDVHKAPGERAIDGVP